MCKECGGTCGGSKVNGMSKKNKIRGFSGGRLMRSGLNMGGAYGGMKIGAMIQEYEEVQKNSLLVNGLIIGTTIVFGDKIAAMIDNVTKSDAGTMLVTNIGASSIDPLLSEIGIKGIESEPDWANQYGYYQPNAESGNEYRVDN